VGCPSFDSHRSDDFFAQTNTASSCFENSIAINQRHGNPQSIGNSARGFERKQIDEFKQRLVS
jgi:hypothetical protein